MKNSLQSKKGFIALISIFIISTTLFSSVLAASEVPIAYRFMLLDFENKIKSQKLAESCIGIAKLYVYNNPLITEDALPYEGVMPIRNETCTIDNIKNSTDSIREIHVSAKSGTAHTRIVLKYDISNEDVLSWEENP